jgi:carboxyl-terminal processing protease
MSLKLLPLVFVLSVFSSPSKSETPKKNDMSSTERYRALETFAKALFYIETMYVDSNQSKLPSLIENAIEGMTSKLDPHTLPLSKHAFEQLTSDTKGQIGGVGIIVKSEGGKLIVITAVDGKPAMKKGVKSGDEIIAINDVPIGKIGTEVLELMRGEPGTTVKLTIKRKDIEKPMDFKLTREIIQISSVTTENLTEGLFFARITNFQENTSQDLQTFLSKNKANLKGLILDLRNNPGGLLEEAVKVADLFVESGLIVSTVGRFRDKVEREFAHKQNTFSGFPLIVLINEGSASASEIVAGALQDHQRGLIMGTPSFGKGSVQTLIALPDGSGLKLTIATYYTPNDRSIQAKGIQPDILLNRQMVVPSAETKKEVNLRGHLLSDDLSFMAKKGNFLGSVRAWPSYLSEDYQVITAFTYLTGWSLFGTKPKTDKDGKTRSNIR